MASSSRSVSFTPIQLICEDNAFIYRLIAILLKTDTCKQKSKKAWRKAQIMIKQLNKALNDCVNNQNIESFECFLKNISTSFTKEIRYQMLQEFHRHINSTEVTFSQKFQTTWKFLGVRWVSEGNLLVMLNKQLNQAIKENETTSQTYSLHDLYHATTQYISSLNVGMIVLGGLLAQAQVADAKPVRRNSCPVNASPLKYSWQRQCPSPSQIPLSKQMPSSKAKSLYENYLVYSNYPLEYVTTFAFGVQHRHPSSLDTSPNENQVRVAADISAIANPFDVAYQEGRLSSSGVVLCRLDRHPQSWSNGTNIYNSKSLRCSGWEPAPQNIYDEEIVPIIAQNTYFNRILVILGLKADPFDKFKSLDVKIIRDRNRGIISLTEKASEHRSFITAGAMHFFSDTNPMYTYSSEEKIGEFRQHMDSLEARGRPVALLCSYHDESAQNIIQNNRKK